MINFVSTSGRTPEMACTECVPFLRRSIHKIKNKKGNKKLAAVHFLMWKFCRETWGTQRNFCSVSWVSCRWVFGCVFLKTEKGRGSSEWVVIIHKFTQSVEIILAVSSFLLLPCCWQSRCFSQGIAWLFANSFSQRHSPELVVCTAASFSRSPWLLLWPQLLHTLMESFISPECLSGLMMIISTATWVSVFKTI